MIMEKPQYSRIESVYDASATAAVATSSTSAPRTLRHKVSRAFSTLTRRDPGSPSSPSCERERGPAPPPTSPAAELGTGKGKERQGALKRTWGLARARSEPALRAKRAKAAAAAMLGPPAPAPAVPSKSAPAPATTHSRDVNAYAHAQGRESGGAVAAYTYPLWRIDPVLVGCFVCL